MTEPLRGQVYRVDLGHGPKPWLIVSNNSRNRNLDTVIAARITTTTTSRHARIPTVVLLSSADRLVGFVVVDDIIPLYRDELTTPWGVLSPVTMRAVSAALRIALP